MARLRVGLGCAIALLLGVATASAQGTVKIGLINVLSGQFADVSADDLDLLAGDGVAVLLHVGLDPVVELDARVGELAGQNVDQPDLDGALRARGCDAEQQRDGAAKSHA